MRRPAHRRAQSTLHAGHSDEESALKYIHRTVGPDERTYSAYTDPRVSQASQAAPQVALDPKLATYHRDGLLTYPSSCFRGTKLATKA